MSTHLYYLDPRSIGLTFTLGSTLLALVLNFAGTALRWRLPGQRISAQGTLLLVTSAVGLSFPDVLPAWAMALFQALTLCAWAVLTGGMRLQHHRTPHWWALVFFCSIGISVAFIGWVIAPNPRFRIGMLAFWQATLALHLAWMCLRETRSELQQGMRAFGIGVLSIGLFLLFRAITVGILGRLPAVYTQPMLANAVLALIAGVSILTIIIGQLLTASGDWIAERRHAALHDPLTDLSNRLGLRHWLNTLAPDTPLALALIDTDHLKRINDQWGHPVGDKVLQHLAALMHAEPHPRRKAVRLGGEEFLIVQDLTPPNETAEQAFMDMLERLRLTFHQIPIPECPTPLSFSAGIATGHAGAFEQLLQAADERMYHAKAQGRNCILANPMLHAPCSKNNKKQ